MNREPYQRKFSTQPPRPAESDVPKRPRSRRRRRYPLWAVLLMLLGAGTLLGVQVMPANYLPMGILVKPAGGFIVLGLMLALMNKLLPKKA